MPSNKERLYIALYPSGVVGNEERRYHWGFLIGPKVEKKAEVPGVRYHVRNTPGGGWQYEERELTNVRNTSTLLARIMIAKIDDKARLIHILRTLQVVQNDPNWRCRSWVANALEVIKADGKAVGTSELDWSSIEPFAREYVRRKTADGRYESGMDMSKPKPTYDFIEKVETVP